MSVDLNQFYVWTLNAKDGVPVGFREKMDIPVENRDEVLKSLHRESALSDQSSILYLSTCHRVELYAFNVSVPKLVSLWQKHTRPFVCRAKALQGGEAISHLFRVVASLESEVLGETQITGQVKDAAIYCKNLGVLHGPLERCLQWSQKAAKKVRNDTQLSSGTVSVAHVAVDGLSDVFESLQNKEALLVGAGPMALQALERAKHQGLQKITWINRTKEKISTHPLAAQCNIQDFSQLHDLFWKNDIIIMATSTPLPLVSRDLLLPHKPPASFNSKSPQVVLDLGHPRNVAEDVHGFEGFYVRNVDEFRDRAGKNTELRNKEKGKALSIIAEETSKLTQVLSQTDRGPLIGEISSALEGLFEQERINLKLEKTQEIVYFCRAVHGKLLHRIIQESESYDELQSVEFLKALLNAWRHTDQWPLKNQEGRLNPPNLQNQKAKVKKNP